MINLSIQRQDKINALETAKIEFEADLYKTLAKLGLDPDTYNVDNFDFDENVPPDKQEIDYLLQKHANMLIERLAKIRTKLAEV